MTNLALGCFARHYGARVKVCRPYCAPTTGTVERPIRCLRESFLFGRTFVSDADLKAQILSWLEIVAHARVHGATGWVPIRGYCGAACCVSEVRDRILCR
ncbi:MAG: hypothetical protein ABIT38_06760 [Gemmatimonadaceae bacterium]